MRKIFWLLLAIGLLALFVTQSYFDYECKEVGAQAADLTVQGVMCWYELEGFRKYETLDQLRENLDSKRKLEACQKAHPYDDSVCEKRYLRRPVQVMNG